MYKRKEVETRKLKAPSLLQRLEYFEKKLKEPKRSTKSKLPDWLQGID